MKPRHGFLLLAFAVILSVVVLHSCCGGGNKNQKKVVIIKVQDTGYRLEGMIQTIKIIEVDGCEYLYGDWANATVLTHKGNCKYCKRNLN